MSKERIDKLNDRNSLIVFCANKKVCLISEDRQHMLILNNTGPRWKRLTRKILKSILSRWKESSFRSIIPLIFKEQDNIENRILEFAETLTLYRSLKLKWYYTVSL